MKDLLKDRKAIRSLLTMALFATILAVFFTIVDDKRQYVRVESGEIAQARMN